MFLNCRLRRDRNSMGFSTGIGSSRVLKFCVKTGPLTSIFLSRWLQFEAIVTEQNLIVENSAAWINYEA